MKEKSALYKKQITALNKECNDLKIYENDNLTRQFHIVSAGLLNYLPQIHYSRHEAIFKNILLHQRLSILEQGTSHVLRNVITKGFTAQTMRLLKAKPTIICTFHLGSYRLINLLLAKHSIPFSLVAAQKVVRNQGSVFKTLYNQFCNNDSSDNFNLIDAESSNSALQMFRELKKRQEFGYLY
ncbi:hypothetical protein [Parafilimonas sp.]|uniref:hypothetical protein n=1 Tax=Parafilimonas sp. TaxID=1969739 RepID=UPI0039E519CC